MFKKVISVVVLTVMVFSFAACNQSTSSSDNELAGYKASALSELEAYTESKDQDNKYFDAEWETIMLLYSNAELAIDEAKSASEIESIVETTKKKIDKVAKNETSEEKINSETWEERTEIGFSVAFKNVNACFTDHKGVQSSNNIGVLSSKSIVINNFNEWRALVEKQNISVAELIEKYNEQYFENKSLILYECSTSTNLEMIDVIKIERELTTIYLQVNIKTGYYDVVSGGNLVIEVDKNFVQGVSNIDIGEMDIY